MNDGRGKKKSRDVSKNYPPVKAYDKDTLDTSHPTHFTSLFSRTYKISSPSFHVYCLLICNKFFRLLSPGIIFHSIIFPSLALSLLLRLRMMPTRRNDIFPRVKERLILLRLRAVSGEERGEGGRDKGRG